MVEQNLYISIAISLVGPLAMGIGWFFTTSINKVSKKEFEESREKQEKYIDKRVDEIEYKVEKERKEIERLFNKEIQILTQQIDFVISGINEIKDKIRK